MEGIQQETKQHNLFSKERRLSLKGKVNSPRDRFVPPREMAIENSTPPRGRLIALRENDAGKFRECSLRNSSSFLRGKFTSPNDKGVGKVTKGRFPRGGSGDRVVPLSKRRFLLEDILQRVYSFPQERRLRTTSLFQGRRHWKGMFL